MKKDIINHPPHYNTGKIEVIDYLEDKFADNPWLWQVVRYASRAKHKENELQDCKKARWYLDRYIKRLEKK